MDFTKFINSNAIRKHLKEINYEFTPKEAAFVVWQSKTHTMKQKHEAFRYIIDNMPDCPIEQKPWSAHNWTIEHNTLHKMLKRFMEVEYEIIDAIKKDEENAIYSVRAVYTDFDYENDERFFTSYDKCLKAAMSLEGCEADPFYYYEITKQWSDADKARYTSMKVLENGEVLSVSDENCSFIKDCMILGAFDDMWFKFPVPFKKGDIVYVKKKGYVGYSPYGTEPFVLEGICYDLWTEKQVESKKEHGDLTDMTAYGYFQNENGEVFYECMHDYFSLEYYPEKLEGRQKILKALSSYLKEQINADLLMNAYNIILAEEKVNKQRKQLGITDEGLQLAGLKDESLLDLLYSHLKNTIPGGLYTIAGRPAIGKSLVAESIADEMTNIYHKNVKYILCEKTIDKIVSQKQKADYDFVYEVGVSIKRIEEELKNPDIDVLIIDSYNFMDRKGIDCAAELKKLARKYQKQIIVLSSVSRKTESRKDKRPVKEDMTKQMCDSLWESSDAVIFLYRDSYYDRESDNENIEIIIAKNGFYIGDFKYNSVSSFNYDYNKLKERAGY